MTENTASTTTLTDQDEADIFEDCQEQMAQPYRGDIMRLVRTRKALREALAQLVDGYHIGFPCTPACELTHWGTSHLGDQRPLRDALLDAERLLTATGYKGAR